MPSPMPLRSAVDARDAGVSWRLEDHNAYLWSVVVDLKTVVDADVMAWIEGELDAFVKALDQLVVHDGDQ